MTTLNEISQKTAPKCNEDIINNRSYPGWHERVDKLKCSCGDQPVVPGHVLSLTWLMALLTASCIKTPRRALHGHQGNFRVNFN